MSVKTDISLKNMDADTLYVDEDNIVSAKRAIKNDLKNIIQDLNNIESHYKTLRDHPATKGSWKNLAASCVQKSNQYEKKMEADRTSIEAAVDDAVQQYVITQIQELRKLQSSADSIVSQ